MAEFELIERIRLRAGSRSDVILGIGDDAALLLPPANQLLAVSTDVLNEGVHFRASDAPFDIGWKALAVNLSDLAAMGAEPAWALLTLALPEAEEAWLDRFIDGFLTLATGHGVALVGGDTTRGALSIGVTVHGFVPPAQALRRSGAKVGDDLWVTGTLGDAAAGLADSSRPDLAARLYRPTPRVSAGLALRGLASGCIDISDGLFADLGHVLRASEAGATVQLASLPTSPALARMCAGPDRWLYQCAGGDDYELCFSAPPAHRQQIGTALALTGTPACVIGRIDATPGLRAVAPDGRHWQRPRAGYQHFEGM
ncbi:MAG: thiamine-phosphate kinase [Pseudomarimonas sp.]